MHFLLTICGFEIEIDFETGKYQNPPVGPSPE
jgi:hypothetical protein